MINKIRKLITKALMRELILYQTMSKLRSFFVVWKWNREGKPIPAPNLIKQRTVKKYAKEFELDILVETGTYFGGMVIANIRAFSEIYSIELHDLLYKRAEKLFSKFPYIHILHGDSSKVLPDLLSSISRPCLFWLDAHYSGEGTAKGDAESPIVEELQCILNHSILEHVILIDDARFFTGQNGYPSIDEVKELVSISYQDWVVENKYDIIRITPSWSTSISEEIL